MSITNTITTVAIAVCLFASCFAVAFAQENATSTERNARAEERTNLEALRAERQAEIEERRSMIEERRAEARAALSEERQEHITGLARAVIARLEGATSKLSGFVTRITEHAASLSARGVDVSEALRLVANAEEKLEEAELILSGINTDVEYVMTSETPRDDWSQVRAQFTESKTLITEVHGLLREAVATLQSAKAGAANN